ncbi:MAG: PEP-CTERM sorting domain-containing protein [Opitutales bacterium]|nr:PEP-CTERM sorting domain-containing protein [Opitutales bacterium]
MHLHLKTIAAILAAIAITGTSLSAQTTLVTNYTGSVTGRNQIGEGQACSFTVGEESATLAGISAFFKISNTSFTASIHRNNAGAIGSTICTSSISGLTTGTIDNLNFSNFSGNTELDANTTYWLVISPDDVSTTTSGWFVADVASTSTFGWEINNGLKFSSYGSWYNLSTSAAAQFSVYTVPEPATYAGLLGMGALGIALIRRKRS